MNWIKKITIGSVLSLCSIIFFFLVAEIGVRLLSPDILPSTKYDWSSRHEGYTLEKPSDTFRIVVLGDSFTYGQGVKRDQTFPERLEYLLNNSGEKKIEVINLGLCGLSTDSELEILTRRGLNPDTWLPEGRYRGLAYTPDLILLEYTLNDAARNRRRLGSVKRSDDDVREKLLRTNFGPYKLPLPESLDKFMTRNSRFYLFFLGRYHQVLARFGFREGGDRGIKATINRFNEDSVGWAISKQALMKIANVSRKKGIPAVLAVYPQMFRLGDYPFQEVHEKVIRFADIAGFHAFDLFQAFKGLDGESLRVSSIDGHPNGRAHKIAAEAIFEYLKKEELVPGL